MTLTEQPKRVKLNKEVKVEDFVGAFLEVDFEYGMLLKTDEELDRLISNKLVESYGYKIKP